MRTIRIICHLAPYMGCQAEISHLDKIMCVSDRIDPGK